MAMRHGLNLEEGEEVVEVIDYVDEEGEEEDHQQVTAHNIQQSRNSMLVEGSRQGSFLEEQASSSK